MILHRDLKLENILFSNRQNNEGVKIVDFGLATFTDRTDIFKQCGTPGYVAPEMLHDKDYGTKVDIFSTSVMLFSLYLPPFYQTHLTFKDSVAAFHSQVARTEMSS